MKSRRWQGCRDVQHQRLVAALRRAAKLLLQRPSRPLARSAANCQTVLQSPCRASTTGAAHRADSGGPLLPTPFF
jgi:hypothetical protein